MKLAIVGSYTPTRQLFDFEKHGDYEVWVFNEAAQTEWCQRADVVFQMHEDIIWKNPGNRNDPNHVHWLRNVSGKCNACGGKSEVANKACPACRNGIYTPPAKRMQTAVYMQKASEEIPNSKEYPLDGILSLLGDRDNHFLSSSVALALGLAAYLGIYEKIEIYGVGMKTNTEYKWQREGVSFWLGYMKGRGIDVQFIGDTFHMPIYGYDGQVAIEYEQFEKRIAELRPQADEARQEYEKQKMNVSNNVKVLELASTQQARDAVLKSVQALLMILERVGKLDGMIQENERYLKKADVMKSNAGNFIFSRQEFESSATQLKQRSSSANAEWISLATTLEHVERNALQAAKGSPKRRKLFELYKQTMDQYLVAYNKVMLFEGAGTENVNYMSFLDQHIIAAGGEKSEAIMLEAMANV